MEYKQSFAKMEREKEQTSKLCNMESERRENEEVLRCDAERSHLVSVHCRHCQQIGMPCDKKSGAKKTIHKHSHNQ
ncbi:Uncharacterized protein TCM_031765 [Theobroma cacao]|uniref:Uncharacterized protein n=1 Tax=Theobroma cacao TaxID=3641 RepID=A0A061F983_THECC|nr:Uncharacterized protein TCM_031765 [Theobroma cacao]